MVLLPQVQAVLSHILLVRAAVKGNVLLPQIEMVPDVTYIELVASNQVVAQLQGYPFTHAWHERQLQGEGGRQVDEGIEVQVHLVGGDF